MHTNMTGQSSTTSLVERIDHRTTDTRWRDTMFDGNDERYYYTVRCGGAARQKRIEYPLDNWEEDHIDPPDEFVRIANCVDSTELCEQLFTKVPADPIKIFRLGGVETDIDLETVDTILNAPEKVAENSLSKKPLVDGLHGKSST